MKRVIFSLLVIVVLPIFASDLVNAIKSGDINLVKSAISAGADLNIKFEVEEIDKETTPLMLASYYGYLEIVKTLVENKADVFARDSSLDTALIIAQSKNHEDVVEYLKPYFKEFKYQFFNTSEEIKWSSSLNEAIEKAKKENKYIIAVFMRIGCKWSKKMGESTFRDESVIHSMNNSFIPVLLDKEVDEYPSDISIKYTPAIFFINANGDIKRKIYGYKDVETFLEELKRFEERSKRNLEKEESKKKN
jgi:thioredoxin-related protein